MKSYSLSIAALSITLVFGAIYGCKKDSGSGADLLFSEEFQDVLSLPSKGWVLKDNSILDSFLIGSGLAEAPWDQGASGIDKSGNPYGLTAYSYKDQPDEYAFSLVTYSSSSYSLSSWMITPIITVENGNRISFYTTTYPSGDYSDRMQVLMDESTSIDVGAEQNSVGGFTKILLDINPDQASNQYPLSWKKFEYTFSGLSGKLSTRLAFRHYVVNSPSIYGVAVDQFQVWSK